MQIRSDSFENRQRLSAEFAAGVRTEDPDPEYWRKRARRAA